MQHGQDVTAVKCTYVVIDLLEAAAFVVRHFARRHFQQPAHPKATALPLLPCEHPQPGQRTTYSMPNA